ncbi:MAG TPA: MauE/DoxX family redox-associated membrane protein [Acidimicrobiia bacterium]|nr:MauE/DoxX family redox-associated membrane protein [Acidimicrobiia bacterium]
MTADDVALAARVVVALILVFSGAGKLVAVARLAPTFRGHGALYATVAIATAVSLPVAELVLAALLLFVDAAWPAYLAVVAFVIFTVVLVRRMIRDDRRPCNCFGAATKRRNLSIGSLVRNSWFLVLAVIGTGAATMQEPSAVWATALVAVAFGGVSAVLIART